MKKVLFVALIVVLSLAVAGVAFAGVAGSKHDLGTSGAAGALTNAVGISTSQVCIFCHHPHRGDGLTNANNDLLWNMNVPATTYATYVNTSTMTANGGAVTASAPQSFLCMSCHNGSFSGQVVAKGAADDSFSTGSAFNIGAGADLTGTAELQDDHPVNIIYAEAAGDIETNVVSGAVIGNVSSNEYPLYSGLMQCATCHDVHAGDNSADAGIQFLRGNTASSEICQDCHTNK